MDVSDFPQNLMNRSVFDSGAFEESLDRAKMLSLATITPDLFRGSIENCMVALELSRLLNTSVITIMQSLTLIDSKMGWRAEFIIALVNTCGRFTKLSFDWSGEGEEYGCIARSKVIASGEELFGAKVDWRMVKLAGWHQGQDSQWLTMPELMFPYRAAAFWIRHHAPDLLLGMRMADELQDYRRGRSNGNMESVEGRNRAETITALLDQQSNQISDLATTQVQTDCRQSNGTPLEKSTFTESVTTSSDKEGKEMAPVDLNMKADRTSPAVVSKKKRARRTSATQPGTLLQPLF